MHPKKALMLFVVIILGRVSFAQFGFREHGDYAESNKYYYVDSLCNLSKNNDFELRISTDISVSRTWRFFVLSFKNNRWTGRFFIKENYTIKESEVDLPIREINPDDKKIDKLWGKLKAFHILTIRDQDSIKNAAVEKFRADIYDGIGYHFELITDSTKRSFHYSCPKLFRNEFKDIKEFKWIVDIIIAINLAFNLPKEMVG